MNRSSVAVLLVIACAISALVTLSVSRIKSRSHSVTAALTKEEREAIELQAKRVDEYVKAFDVENAILQLKSQFESRGLKWTDDYTVFYPSADGYSALTKHSFLYMVVEFRFSTLKLSALFDVRSNALKQMRFDNQ